MEKSVKEACYSKSISKASFPIETIVEDFELQYNKDHIVEKVKVGETDIFKEVQSHVNEVGLINVVKNAIAHGEDPLVKFARTGESVGIQTSIDPNATLDDINELIQSNDQKYANIAATLGVSVEDLKQAINNGSLGTLIENASKSKEIEKGSDE